MQPYYLLQESLLRRNLSLIQSIAERAGVEFILAFKAFALWKTFPVFREYIRHTTASSPYEARLAFEEFGSKAHTYSPAYEEETFGEIVRCSSHITFNSLSQYERFAPQVFALGNEAPALGLRINPEHSEIETELYNPCAPGSRFGVLASQLPEVLPEGITGFHCHCHCESPASALTKTLGYIEEKFGKWLPQIQWLNLGGGHLVTRKDYDVEGLIATLQGFKAKSPPRHYSRTRFRLCLADRSPRFRSGRHCVERRHQDRHSQCQLHLPHARLPEMPYHPAVRGAETIEDAREQGVEREACVYRWAATVV